MRWSRTFSLLALVALLAACDDSTRFRIDPLLVTDTVVVAVPIPQNDGLPSALDITADGIGGINGGRFPELPRDALQWDFAVRLRDGQIVLVPAAVLGVTGSGARAAITFPIEGETFETLREVPGQRNLFTDSIVAMQPGRVYAARSRRRTDAFFQACEQFAKLEPLEVDPATGILRLQIVTNSRCGDPRLVPVD